MLSGVARLRFIGPKPKLTLIVNEVEECSQIAHAYDIIHFTLS
jgi:hypothetical protein